MALEPFVIDGYTKVGNELIPNSKVDISVNGKHEEITSDEKGYFQIDISRTLKRRVTKKDKIVVSVTARLELHLKTSKIMKYGHIGIDNF